MNRCFSQVTFLDSVLTFTEIYTKKFLHYRTTDYYFLEFDFWSIGPFISWNSLCGIIYKDDITK